MAKKGGHGGRRAGAGRRPHPEQLLVYSYRMTPAQARLLRLWGGGNGSIGLRWLVDVAAQFMVRAETDGAVGGPGSIPARP